MSERDRDQGGAGPRKGPTPSSGRTPGRGSRTDSRYSGVAPASSEAGPAAAASPPPASPPGGAGGGGSQDAPEENGGTEDPEAVFDAAFDIGEVASKPLPRLDRDEPDDDGERNR